MHFFARGAQPRSQIGAVRRVQGAAKVRLYGRFGAHLDFMATGNGMREETRGGGIGGGWWWGRDVTCNRVIAFLANRLTRAPGLRPQSSNMNR